MSASTSFVKSGAWIDVQPTRHEGEPHVWLFIIGKNNYDEAGAHLTPDEVKRLMSALRHALKAVQS